MNDEALQKVRRGTIIERGVPFLLQFVAAASDGPSIDVRHRLEQGGIELHRVFCFRQREFGDRRAEAELQPLQQDGMVYSSFRPAPAEYPVAQDDFHAFGFALHTAM